MPKKSSRDSLSVEWGRFKASAIGRFAIGVVAMIALAIVVANAFGFWKVSSTLSSFVANEQAAVARRQ